MLSEPTQHKDSTVSHFDMTLIPTLLPSPAPPPYPTPHSLLFHFFLLSLLPLLSSLSLLNFFLHLPAPSCWHNYIYSNSLCFFAETSLQVTLPLGAVVTEQTIIISKDCDLLNGVHRSTNWFWWGNRFGIFLIYFFLIIIYCLNISYWTKYTYHSNFPIHLYKLVPLSSSLHLKTDHHI